MFDCESWRNEFWYFKCNGEVALFGMPTIFEEYAWLCALFGMCTIQSVSHFIVDNWLKEHISIAVFANIMSIFPPMWLWTQNVNFVDDHAR